MAPQKPVSYAKLLNGHAARPSLSHADTDTATEEDSVLDAVTTSERSTPPKGASQQSQTHKAFFNSLCFQDLQAIAWLLAASLQHDP